MGRVIKIGPPRWGPEVTILVIQNGPTHIPIVELAPWGERHDRDWALTQIFSRYVESIRISPKSPSYSCVCVTHYCGIFASAGGPEREAELV